MLKFIIGTFAILGATFYVLSGGAAFEPEVRQAVAEPEAPPVVNATPAPVDAPATPEPVVADAAPAIAVEAPAPETVTAEAVALDTAPVFDGTIDGVAGIAPAFTSLAAPAPGAPATASLSALRAVAGRAVNMREGPDTSFAVIDTLPQGTQAEIIASDDSGWVQVQIPATGQTGWIAERLLTP
ncbi:SH3 domain-containing protein [Loktanella fryxellensis]|uniref:SH3 domain-containing protein n=1 Tax=Loktanella fryxellensis TaxID=245187 RepID=A0A1H8ILL1_9RHOB|nr:SH3 domain-containing protein [Loktanella fryxellensis]SEN69222.1 SH3 domain-containing protein [Loktanella fryxellensis]